VSAHVNYLSAQTQAVARVNRQEFDNNLCNDAKKALT